ncbi:MAG: HDOD domain-containing protein [Syntrophomonadaceae bacterium]|nr:HDOD domain-containing protein [Syntrophomonadaceae bacterium]
MKKRILFVDDEQPVILGLKRTLHSIKNEWELYFACSAGQALQILACNPVDVLVTDIRMPEIDGAQLLERVRELYPDIIRIVLSGYSDEQMLLHSVKNAHQFVTKPTDGETLKRVIYRACLLREKLKDPTLLAIVTGIEDLHSLPGIYHRLLDEIESIEPSVDRIVKIISSDMAMTARVLQLTNSAFFGISRKVTSPKQAVAILGLNTLRALVIKIGLFSSFDDRFCSMFSLQDLWSHSLMVGSTSRQIVQCETNDPVLAETAFTAGVLHDIGILPMLRMAGCYEKIQAYAKHKGCCWVEAEYEILGVSHAEIGAYLLSIWGLPDEVLEPVMFHHRPSEAGSCAFMPLTAVHAANAFLRPGFGNLMMNRSSCLDLDYLDKINMLGRIEHWRELVDRIGERDVYL